MKILSKLRCNNVNRTYQFLIAGFSFKLIAHYHEKATSKETKAVIHNDLNLPRKVCICFPLAGFAILLNFLCNISYIYKAALILFFYTFNEG